MNLETGRRLLSLAVSMCSSRRRWARSRSKRQPRRLVLALYRRHLLRTAKIHSLVYLTHESGHSENEPWRGNKHWLAAVQPSNTSSPAAPLSRALPSAHTSAHRMKYAPGDADMRYVKCRWWWDAAHSHPRLITRPPLKI